MATSQRRAGKIQFNAGGVLYDCVGNFSYNLGSPKREALVGSSGVQGFSEKPQVAFIEGEIRDRIDLDLKALVTAENITVQLVLNVGKSILLNNAWYAGEGTGNSDEANIGIKFESSDPGVETT